MRVGTSTSWIRPIVKILDRYILSSYLKTFFSVFIILMFIFVLQTIWLYIAELAGKDLDVWVVLKFLWYVSPRLIPLVLPLTILVTSLMVFGSFSEKYEFAAMKANGISLQRAMKSLMLFIGGLAILAFFFANNVIPYSEYKWKNLRRNIAQVSPAMAIVEGQFSSIGENFNIKVDKKSGDREQYLTGVVIHQKNPDNLSKNTTVIIAKEGELASAEGSNTLSLILKDGNYYEDVILKNKKKERNNLPFVKSYFEEYTINIDLTALYSTDIDKDNNVSDHNMYKIDELFREIDTLSRRYTEDIKLFGNTMYYRFGLSRVQDTNRRRKEVAPDKEFMDLFNINQQSEILGTAIDNVRGSLQTVQGKKREFQIKTKRLNKHEIALHEKYVLGVACIILFFVGAPLGAIIRKGGMGLPMVVAILLFLTYHFIGIFAKNSAEDGTLPPFVASWLSTAIMLPIGIWLTYRATTDQGIMDWDAFRQRLNRILGRKEKEEVQEAPLILTQYEKALVLSKSEDELIGILRNFDQLDHSEDVRKAIIKRLMEKGYSEQELTDGLMEEHSKHILAQESYKRFLKSSKYASIAWVATLAMVMAYVLLFGTKLNLGIIGFKISVYLRPVSFVIYMFFFVKSLIHHTQFYKAIGKKQDGFMWLFTLLIGILMYVVVRQLFKKQMKEQLEYLR